MIVRNSTRVRVLDEQSGSVFAVDLNRGKVYQAKKRGTDENYKLPEGTRPYEAQGGELRRDADVQEPKRSEVLREAANISFSKPLMTPGVRHRAESHWVSGGIIPNREWEQLQAGASRPAFRAARSTHLDLFDLEREGRVTLGDQFKTWQALGTSVLMAPVKAVITGFLFGTRKRGHFFEIDTGNMRKPKGGSGLYREDGSVDGDIARKVRAMFTPEGDLAAAAAAGRAPVLQDGIWIREADFRRVVNEASGQIVSGVPKRQWQSTFDAIARLNQYGERKIRVEQFEALLEGSLPDLSASQPHRKTAKAPIQTLYRPLFEHRERLAQGLADGLRAAPESYIQRVLKTTRPELTIAQRDGDAVPAPADSAPSTPR